MHQKIPEAAVDYLDYRAENAQHQDTVGSYESKNQSLLLDGGMYNHRDIQNLQAKFASPARKFKALE